MLSAKALPIFSNSEYELILAWEEDISGHDALLLLRAGEAYASVIAAAAPRKEMAVFVCCGKALLGIPLSLPNEILPVEFCLHGQDNGVVQPVAQSGEENSALEGN